MDMMAKLGWSLFCLLVFLGSETGAVINCDSPYACDNAVDTQVQCRGGFSCADTNYTISSGNQQYCHGTYSCFSVKKVLTSSSHVNCRGLYACRESVIENQALLLCYGGGSCISSTISESTYFGSTAYGTSLYCSAWASCALSTISGQPDIEARGNYSLYGSTIHSGGTDMTMELHGNYAGYNASIYCDSGDTCTIDCRDNGCLNTYIYYDENNVIVTCNSTESDCPIELTTSQVVTLSLQYDLVDDSEITKVIDDSNSKEIYSYQGSYYNYGSTYTWNNGSIACGGWYSCGASSTSSKFVVNGPDDSLFCNGYYSCYSFGSIYLRSDNDIYCGGLQTCKYGNIIATNSVYCLGFSSCDRGTIFKAKNLYCGSQSACAYTNIIGVENIYSSSYFGLFTADIYSNGTNINVYLSGYRSGDEVTIHCEEGDSCFVSCETNSACRTSEYSKSATLECAGDCIYYCEPQYSIQCPDITIIGSGTATRITIAPTQTPTLYPTMPTKQPTSLPTLQPTDPTNAPSSAPTIAPSSAPTSNPSQQPTIAPSMAPTAYPTAIPSDIPTFVPSSDPTEMPSDIPTAPSLSPTLIPTGQPTDPYITRYNFSILIGNGAANSGDEYIVFLETPIKTRNYTIDGLTSNDTWYDYSVSWYFFGVVQKFTFKTTADDSDLTIKCVKMYNETVCVNNENGTQTELTLSRRHSSNSEACRVIEFVMEWGNASCTSVEETTTAGPTTSSATTTHTTESEMTTTGPMNTTNEQENESITQEQNTTDWNSIATNTVFGLVFVALLALGIGCAFHAIVTGSDKPDFLSILRSIVGIADLWSDILFAFVLYSEDYSFLFYAAIGFVAIPYVLQLSWVIYRIRKWKNAMGVRMPKWLEHYGNVLIALSGIFGFYSSLDLCRSKLFYLELFHIPLKRHEYHSLKMVQLIMVGLFENLPQIGIQIVYMFVFESITLIAVISFAFSVLSIIMTLWPIFEFCCHFKPTIVVEGFVTLESHNLRQKHAFAHSHMKKCLDNTLRKSADMIDAKYEIEVFHFDNTIKESGQMTCYFDINIAGSAEQNENSILEAFGQVMENLGSSVHDDHQRLLIQIEKRLKLHKVALTIEHLHTKSGNNNLIQHKLEFLNSNSTPGMETGNTSDIVGPGGATGPGGIDTMQAGPGGTSSNQEAEPDEHSPSPRNVAPPAAFDIPKMDNNGSGGYVQMVSPMNGHAIPPMGPVPPMQLPHMGNVPFQAQMQAMPPMGPPMPAGPLPPMGPMPPMQPPQVVQQMQPPSQPPIQPPMQPMPPMGPPMAMGQGDDNNNQVNAVMLPPKQPDLSQGEGTFDHSHSSMYAPINEGNKKANEVGAIGAIPPMNEEGNDNGPNDDNDAEISSIADENGNQESDNDSLYGKFQD